MSGHSKWASIKRKKGATDVKRGQLFSRLAKQVTIAARLGKNLDMTVAAAKAANMPKENIERAIAKGSGAGAEGVQIEEVTYEAFGPGGAAILITALTDNRNRTIGELRTLASKLGFQLANPGAVRHLFDYVGTIDVAGHDDPDSVQLALIDAGATDVTAEDGTVVGTFVPTTLDAGRRSLETQGIQPTAVRLIYVPKLIHAIGDDDRAKLLRILEAIDELEDVDSVETNAEL